MPIALNIPFKTIPYWHQLAEFERYADCKNRALLWQMRTGKTKAMIDLACYLFKEKKIDAVVIIAPNGVHNNWAEAEVSAHIWDCVPFTCLVWESSKLSSSKKNKSTARIREDWNIKTPQRLKDKAKLIWWFFNSESIISDDTRKLIKRITRVRKVLIVYDESHDFRTPGSKRSKMMHAISKKCLYRRILTGTPVGNSPLHAWSQFQLLKYGALGFERFTDFKNRYSYDIKINSKDYGKYIKITKYQNIEELKQRILLFSSIVKRKDCCDMPSLKHEIVNIKLNDNQVKLYKEMLSQFIFEINDQKNVSINASTPRLIKLQQIVSGFLVDKNKLLHRIPGVNHRLEAISRVVSSEVGKMIVWCRFRNDIDMVVNRLKNDGHEILEYHGRSSPSEKEEVRAAFKHGAKNNIKCLVGYPTVGLNLSAATTIIWYSHTFDNILREQASERATRIGGEDIKVIDFVSKGIDKQILKSTSNKKTLADSMIKIDIKGIYL